MADPREQDTNVSMGEQARAIVGAAMAGTSAPVVQPQSRYDAPLRVAKPSQLPAVTEFRRFEKMARSWFLRRGFFMMVVGSLTYNAFFCPILHIHPSEERSLIGLKRRRYMANYFKPPNFLQQAFGWQRRVWLFGYNQPLDIEQLDSDYLNKKETEQLQRTRAASETLRYNDEQFAAKDAISFGAAPLRAEDLPANVHWRAEAIVRAEHQSLAALAPERPPLADVLHAMFISAVRGVPRTLTFARPWGDKAGNSVQYNWFLFEPVTFTGVRNVMLPVRPVELPTPDGKGKVKVTMLAQLYYRREQTTHQEVGHMRHGQVEAMLDYIGPQVCDAWLSSFASIAELVQYAPPYRRTATESTLRQLPELTTFLASVGEEPPMLVTPLTMETPKTLERSLVLGAKTMTHEELLRRHLAFKILSRMQCRVAIDDVFWHIVVEDIDPERQREISRMEQAVAQQEIYVTPLAKGNFTVPDIAA